jgi:hypothetical protein
LKQLRGLNMSESIDDRYNSLKHQVLASGAVLWERVISEAIADARARGAGFTIDADSNSGGFYLDTSLWPDGDWEGYPPRLIVVDVHAAAEDRFVTAVHELGHHKCGASGCPCSNPDYFGPLTEVHADQFVLGQLKDTSDVVRHRYISRKAGTAFKMAEAGGDMEKLYLELFALLVKKDSQSAGPITNSPGREESERDGYGIYCNIYRQPIAEIAERARGLANACPDEARRAALIRFIDAAIF